MTPNYQNKVNDWMLQCFGQEIADNKTERNHRFLEEALELVQACECTQEDAHILVDYVFGRPVGETRQEVGGVMVTLAALCTAQKLRMMIAGSAELDRVWDHIPTIRAKQAAKPKLSPLPTTMRTCYQCEKEVNYLFDDSRCGDCTRLTPDEVRGEEDNDDHMREDCPTIEASCEHYSYQCDRNESVAICFCSHPDNPNNSEGNCRHSLCPLTVSTEDDI